MGAVSFDDFVDLNQKGYSIGITTSEEDRDVKIWFKTKKNITFAGKNIISIASY